MSILDREPLSSFLGRGKASITVPVLDGAFRPNDIIEKASVVADVPGCDAIAADGTRLYLSAGNEIFEVTEGRLTARASFAAPISALAVHDELFAVGLANGEIHLFDHSGTRETFREACDRPIVCPTAILFEKGQLIVTEGSSQIGPMDWSRDLLERNRSGRVFSIDLASKRTELLADGLAFANGVVRDAAGKLVVSQSWLHCLSDIDDPDPRRARLKGLPGYPSRLMAASDGGYWLAIFGMRTQLIEFVLRETTFRRRMLETVPPEYWIAPSLEARENFLDPLQQGSVKQLGIKKPWAPPRSYGLVAKLDSAFNPQFSFHSRVGGTRHGITSVCEVGGTLYMVSRGRGQLLSFDIAAMVKDLVQ